MEEHFSDYAKLLSFYAIQAVKDFGVYDKRTQQAIQKLVWHLVKIHKSTAPLYTSEDIRTDVYLKLLDWLSKGKRGKIHSPESLLSPLAIVKMGRSFGFNKGRPPFQIGRLEDYTQLPIPEEPLPDVPSELLETWVKFKNKLLPSAREFVYPC